MKNLISTKDIPFHKMFIIEEKGSFDIKKEKKIQVL